MDYINLFSDRAQWRKDGQTVSGSMCLGNRLLLLSPNNIGTVGRIVRRLFPERDASGGYDGLGSIASFNDHPDTTFEDIQKVLRELQFEMDLHS